MEKKSLLTQRGLFAFIKEKEDKFSKAHRPFIGIEIPFLTNHGKHGIMILIYGKNSLEAYFPWLGVNDYIGKTQS